MASYLLEKDSSAVAHKLNGQIFEKLKQAEKVGSFVNSSEKFEFNFNAGFGEL